METVFWDVDRILLVIFFKGENITPDYYKSAFGKLNANLAKTSPCHCPKTFFHEGR